MKRKICTDAKGNECNEYNRGRADEQKVQWKREEIIRKEMLQDVLEKIDKCQKKCMDEGYDILNELKALLKENFS